eukprot:m.51870 g.51870  ORF g.51870 m.51870 type:complete len:161 (+) comp11266_c0_seq2:1207-1689(+)
MLPPPFQLITRSCLQFERHSKFIQSSDHYVLVQSPVSKNRTQSLMRGMPVQLQSFVLQSQDLTRSQSQQDCSLHRRPKSQLHRSLSNKPNEAEQMQTRQRNTGCNSICGVRDSMELAVGVLNGAASSNPASSATAFAICARAIVMASSTSSAASLCSTCA